MTDRKIVTNFNTSPYFDDFDEDKKFLRVLFRAGKAIQAREVTQLQTIINEQVRRFGDHIFQDGSPVINGSFSIDNTAKYVKLEAGSISTADFSKLVGSVMENVSGARFLVKAISPADETDPNTLVGTYLSGGLEFTDAQAISVEGAPISATTASSSHGGNASLATVDRGYFYVSGFFVLCEQQTLILEKYNNTPSYRVGLTVNESIISEAKDSSLFDNAQGSTNESAPGAHRFVIDLVLSKKELDTGTDITSNASEDFYEFVRVINGVKTDQIVHPQYSYLNETLARRTFDTNGNFTVKNFAIDIEENSGDNTKLNAILDPGKAYVQGYEIETIFPKTLEVDKARTTQSVTSENVTDFVGNYVFIDTTTSDYFFDVSANESVELWDASSQVGTARVKQFRFNSTDKYELSLYDIQMSSGDFGAVRTVRNGSGTTLTIHADSILDSNGVAQGQPGHDAGSAKATLSESNSNALLFQLSNSSVASTSNIDFITKKSASIVITSGGAPLKATGTLSLGAGTNETFLQSTGEISTNAANEWFFVVDTATGDYKEVSDDSTFTDSKNFNIELVDSGFSGTVDVYFTIQVSNATPRTKTATTQTNIAVSGTSIKQVGVANSLGYADIISVDEIRDTGNGNAVVTTRYKLDNGQRDSFYDHGSISLISGEEPPVGPLEVDITYYSHNTADGFFAGADSYAGTNYEDIPTYVSDQSGTVFKLSDVLDFRPTRTANASTIFGAKIPQGSGTDFMELDYNFYLPRIDKVILTKEKEFKVIKGIPAVNPKTPSDDPQAMTLYILTLPPYTFAESDVSIVPIDNRRFTMSDIGKLRNRIQDLEVQNNLRSIEEKTKNLQIFNSSGTEVFKNGILIDDFTGHAVGDINNSDYKCSIDFETSEMRPAFRSENHGFSYNSANSSGAVKVGPYVLAGYSSTEFLFQPLASKSIQVNPQGMAVWYGEMSLHPQSDVWYSQELNPKVNINLEGENDAWQQLASNVLTNIARGYGTQYNDWESLWTGLETSVSKQELDQSKIQVSLSDSLGNRKTRNILDESISSVNSLRSGLPNRIEKDFLNRKVDFSVIPYMREQRLTFVATNLKPNTEFYAFFDSVDINSETTGASTLTLDSQVGTFSTGYGDYEVITSTSGGSATIVRQKKDNGVSDLKYYVTNVTGTFLNGDTVTGATSGATGAVVQIANPVNLLSDEFGQLVGEVLIPSSDLKKIKTGQRLLRLIDNSSNDLSTASSLSEISYYAQGVVSDPENYVISTRLPLQRRHSLSDDLTISRDVFSREKNIKNRTFDWKDPLAQTFIVDESLNRNGIFLESLDLYFKSKDNELPVGIEIRPTVNGYPSTSTVVPFSEVTKNPIDVVVSSGPDAVDANSTYTRFQFDVPVYLAPGEYSVVVKTNSEKYEVWSSEIGVPVLNADGTEDVTNVKITKQPYVGFVFNSQNTNLWEPIYNEALMFRLNRCEFVTGSAEAHFDLNLLDSGSEEYSVFKLTASALENFTNTSGFEWYYKSKVSSGGSLATTWTGFNDNRNIEVSDILELDTALSFQVKADFSTSDSKVSPVLDLERLSLITVENVINNLEISRENLNIINGGSGYKVCDTFKVTGGGNTNEAILTVSAVNSGVITDLIVTDTGSGYTGTGVVEPKSVNGTYADIQVEGEDESEGGQATARYISRRVTLKSGENASDMRVYLDVYNPVGTDVHVYYKAHNENDPETFDQKPYKLMTRITPSFVRSNYENDYRELVFGTAGTGGDSSGDFDNFKTYSIKVVLTSSKKSKVPKVRNLRAIALDEIL
jgi:hypothetical protein